VITGRVAAGRASIVKMVGSIKVGAPISSDGVASSKIVSVSALVIFPFHHKTQKMACKMQLLGITPWAPLHAYTNRRWEA